MSQLVHIIFEDDIPSVKYKDKDSKTFKFIMTSTETHIDEYGDPIYDYTKTQRITGNNYVFIFCPTHNIEFKQNYGSHLRGQTGCKSCIKEKREKTNLKKFGNKNPFQNEDIKKKIIEINLEKYGVKNPMQSEEVKAKVVKTNTEKYGVPYQVLREDFKDKSQATSMKNWGVKFPSQNPIIRERIENTMLERWGVKNALQNPTLLSKQQTSSFQSKDFILPSGKKILLQGFEPQVLKELLDIYEEDDIIIGTENVPNFLYIDDEGIEHTYFPDFYIPSENIIIEVKSWFTLNLDIKRNDLKFRAVERDGFNLQLWMSERNDISYPIYEPY